MEKFLVDRNIILNLIFDVQFYGYESRELWDFFREKCKEKMFECFITDKDLQDISFYIEKVAGENVALEKRHYLTNLFNVCEVNQEVMKTAYGYNYHDFEASIKVACQQIYDIKYLVSFQLSNYNISHDFEVISPRVILRKYSEEFDACQSKFEQEQHKSLKIGDYIIDNFEVFCGSKEDHAKATVWFKNIKTNNIEIIKNHGNGPVNAIYKAINSGISRLEIDIDQYQISNIYAVAIRNGSDAEITFRVGLLFDNQEIKSFGSDVDVLKAAVYAYVSAINKLLHLTASQQNPDLLE